jgi:hypothetical protein
MAKEFEMPKPFSLVLWRAAPDMDPPAPAVVTAVFHRTISCTVFPLDHAYGVAKDGVRFVKDPEPSQIDVNFGGGYWDYTDDQKLLKHLIG